jgi:hypothetical protein
VPTASPEIVIFFKAEAHLSGAESASRPRDEKDFLALLPTLTDAARAWLHRSIATVHRRHPWLPHLQGTAPRDQTKE